MFIGPDSSQWRGYAQDGAGFSVTLDRRKLESLTRNRDKSANLIFSKVSYGFQDTKEVTDVIKNLARAFLEDASKFQEDQNGMGSMSLSYTPDKHTLQHEAASQLFTVKNGAFREEKEWRMFLFNSASKIENIDFRESGHLLSPYVRMKIPSETILGVTLGPTNQTPEAVVEAALKKYELNCWVRKSNASYRSR